MAFTIKDQLKAAAPIYWPFDGKGHKTNQERLLISCLHAKFEQNRSMAKIPSAFFWPLMIKATEQTENGCRQAICTPNLNKIGQ